ncbi:hypothetical protein Ancab_029993 [Ancistrocladus abbreviatus]
MGTKGGLDLSSVVAPGIYSFSSRDLSKDMAHADSSANIIIETNNKFDVEGFLTDQVPHEVDKIQKNEMMSNDTMIQNLKRLDVESYNSKRHSVTSAKPKHRKAFDTDKPTSKKKKTRPKTSSSNFP